MALENVPPTSHVPAPGQPAKAWALKDLPVRMQDELSRMATARGYRSAIHLLTEPPKLWEPPIPLNQIAANFIDEANRRREAFAPALEAQHTVPPGELLARGLESYARVFGHSVSDDTWRRLFDCFVERDGGRGKWTNLAIYLDDRAFSRGAASAGLAAISQTPSLKEPLDDILAELENKVEPTDDDKAWLFHRTMAVYESSVTTKIDVPTLKLAIATEWLNRVPALSSSAASFIRSFERKFAQWTAGGRKVSALRDKRSKNRRDGYQCQPCFELVNKQSRNTHRFESKGNTSEAFFRLWTEGQICPKCVEKFAEIMRRNPRYTPRCFRTRAAPNDLEIAKDKGAKELRSAGPSIPGDVSDTYPGRSFVFDDETPNHYVYAHVDGELVIGVPQNIEGTDTDCDYSLGFNMYFGAPSCIEIMKAFYGVCTTVGIPDEEILLERGVFSARDIIGDKEERSWSDIAAGWNDAYGIELNKRPGVKGVGVDLSRATSPSGKPIEGYFGRTQKIASPLPGFRGFRERDQAPEWLEDFIARCKSGKEDPANELLSLDEFRKNYVAVREDFIRRPQNGKRLKGATPLQMWEDRQERKPIRQLDPNLAHILSTHRRVRPITARGLTLKISKYEDAVYYNGELGEWWGKGLKNALVYRSIFNVNQVTVRNKDGEFLVVPRVLVPRASASKEQLQQANKLRKDYIAGATSRFTPLTHPLVNTILRDTEGNEAEKEVGRFHNAATAVADAQESADAREISGLRREATKLGVSLAGYDLNSPRGRQGARFAIKAVQADDAQL